METSAPNDPITQMPEEVSGLLLNIEIGSTAVLLSMESLGELSRIPSQRPGFIHLRKELLSEMTLYVEILHSRTLSLINLLIDITERFTVCVESGSFESTLVQKSLKARSVAKALGIRYDRELRRLDNLKQQVGQEMTEESQRSLKPAVSTPNKLHRSPTHRSNNPAPPARYVPETETTGATQTTGAASTQIAWDKVPKKLLWMLKYVKENWIWRNGQVEIIATTTELEDLRILANSLSDLATAIASVCKIVASSNEVAHLISDRSKGQFVTWMKLDSRNGKKIVESCEGFLEDKWYHELELYIIQSSDGSKTDVSKEFREQWIADVKEGNRGFTEV
jgi:hypothetical protein